jgi:hypothetical protein
MDVLIAAIERRWCEMFSDLAAGLDVPPGIRLRTEGMMEAAALQGLLSAEQLQQRMDARHLECLGCTLAQQFGEQWRALFPFPQIPAMQHRAPVVPSTGDI